MMLGRLGTVGTTAAGVTTVLALQLDTVLTAAAAARGPEELVTAGCLLVALAIGIWLSASVLVATLALVPGPTARALSGLERRMTPFTVRRLVRHAVGVGVASALAGAFLSPASATSAPSVGRPPHADAVQSEPSGPAARADDLPVLDRLAEPGRWRLHARTAPASATYTVRPGDTLWDIAAAALPGAATDSQVAAAWPRWWRLNRSVVGPDPGMILPGQVLQVPRSAP